jgi:hypothetical protein
MLLSQSDYRHTIGQFLKCYTQTAKQVSAGAWARFGRGQRGMIGSHTPQTSNHPKQQGVWEPLAELSGGTLPQPH